MRRLSFVGLFLAALQIGCGTPQQHTLVPKPASHKARPDRHLVNLKLPSGGQCKDSPSDTPKHAWVKVTRDVALVTTNADIFVGLPAKQRRVGYWLGVVARAGSADTQTQSDWSQLAALIDKHVDQLPAKDQLPVRAALTRQLLLGSRARHVTGCTHDQLRGALEVVAKQGERFPHQHPSSGLPSWLSKTISTVLDERAKGSAAQPQAHNLTFSGNTARLALRQAQLSASNGPSFATVVVHKGLPATNLDTIDSATSPVQLIAGRWLIDGRLRYGAALLVVEPQKRKELQGIADAGHDWLTHYATSSGSGPHAKHPAPMATLHGWTLRVPTLQAGVPVVTSGAIATANSPDIHERTASGRDMFLWSASAFAQHSEAVQTIVHRYFEEPSFKTRPWEACFTRARRALAKARGSVGYSLVPPKQQPKGRSPRQLAQTRRGIATAVALRFLSSPRAAQQSNKDDQACLSDVPNAWIAEQLWQIAGHSDASVCTDDLAGDQWLFQRLVEKRAIRLTQDHGHLTWTVADEQRWRAALDAAISHFLVGPLHVRDIAAKDTCSPLSNAWRELLQRRLMQRRLPSIVAWLPPGVRPILADQASDAMPWTLLGHNKGAAALIHDATIDDSLSPLEALLVNQGHMPWP